MAHSSAQNGVAEQAKHMIFDRDHAMLNDAGLPLNLWAKLTSTAAYLTSHMPPRKGKTPHQMCWGKKLDVSHLHPFEATTYTKI